MRHEPKNPVVKAMADESKPKNSRWFNNPLLKISGMLVVGYFACSFLGLGFFFAWDKLGIYRTERAIYNWHVETDSILANLETEIVSHGTFCTGDTYAFINTSLTYDELATGLKLKIESLNRPNPSVIITETKNNNPYKYRVKIRTILSELLC